MNLRKFTVENGIQKKEAKNQFFLKSINLETLLSNRSRSNIVKFKLCALVKREILNLQRSYDTRKKGRLLLFLWELGTIVGYSMIFYFQNSFGFIPYNYLMASVGLFSVLLLWFYCFFYDRIKHHCGITYYFYNKIFRADINEKDLIEKIKSSQQTSVTLVTAGYAFIGICIAVGALKTSITNNFSYITNFIIINTIIFTLICIILFEIRIDALDMSTYSTMPKSDRIILWKRAGAYYLIGYISFVYAVLLGISLINPFLTVIGTSIYIIIFVDYYYIFD